MIVFYVVCCVIFFFFNDTATTEIYTLSLHDALPICIFKLRSDQTGLNVISLFRELHVVRTLCSLSFVGATHYFKYMYMASEFEVRLQ